MILLVSGLVLAPIGFLWIFRFRKLWAGIFLFLLGLSLIFLYFSPRFQEWIEVDKCLDSGGRWSYEDRRCIGISQ